jgi:POT family proton-dependent oligopeptide transporter
MSTLNAPAGAASYTSEHLDRAFLGHPKGLGYLAFTEAWERFSYYGMQTLLVLYMVKQLLLPGHIEHVWFFEPIKRLYGLQGQPLASAIFGTYTALVYLTPILGGFLADRVLGKRRTVLAGAATMAVGHFLMAFEQTFLFALLCLVAGCGMFKGNLASQVGALYKSEDLRRADAFQIYYLAVNAGVITTPLVVGTLGETVGWHWGFAAAGIGMLIGLSIYVAGQKYLPREEFIPSGSSARVQHPPLSRKERLTTASLVLLIPVLAVAIVPNNQIFNAYLVWGNEQFDLVFFGKKLPTTWLITFDSITSVAFLAGVAVFYRWYGKRRQEPDEITKLIIGSVFSILGMLCLFMAAASKPAGGKIGLLWPVAFHLTNSIAFAHILPVSLAYFAKLAPAKINSTVLGLYYLAFFAGNMLVGWVGGLFEKWPTPRFWLLHAAFAVGSGMVFALFKFFLSPNLVNEPGEKAKNAGRAASEAA